MYYEEDLINNLLKCQKCMNKLDEPKVLECGATICTECAYKIQKSCSISSSFHCELCSNGHIYPKNGFPTNHTLLNILSIKPSKLERTESVNSLKQTLSSLHRLIDQLKSGLNNGVDRIKEYCIDLKTDVQLCTEEAIQKINDINDKFIKEIAEYEKICIEVYESKSKNEFQELIQQVETFHAQWSDEVKKFNISDKIYSDANELGLKWFNKLEKELTYLDDFIFDANKLRFERASESFSTGLLGNLVTDKISINSGILTSQEVKDLLKLCGYSPTQKWKLLYRASVDGFSAASFHRKCDGYKNNLTIVKSTNGNIFGGYTDVPWSHIGGYKSDSNAFIFSLINKDNQPVLIKCSNQQRAIQLSGQHGPVFGGCDFLISNDSNTNTDSYSNLGYYYRHPVYEAGSNEAKCFLAGSFKFQTADIEVFCK